jgi:predicted membrane protein
MSEKRPLSGGAVLLGLAFVVIGVLVLLANLGRLPFDLDIKHWWPLILIVLGLLHLYNNRNIFDFPGLFLVMLGVIFLLATLGRICWSDVWRFWPLALILLGVSIIFRRHPLPPPLSGSKAAPSPDATIQVTNILSGTDRRVNSHEFKGGDVHNVLGGTKIDLLEAKLAPGDWVLTVSTVLGGVEIFVPRDWRIEVHPSNMLGSVDDRTRQAPAAGGGKLIVRASALLGGVDIKN